MPNSLLFQGFPLSQNFQIQRPTHMPVLSKTFFHPTFVIRARILIIQTCTLRLYLLNIRALLHFSHLQSILSLHSLLQHRNQAHIPISLQVKALLQMIFIGLHLMKIQGTFSNPHLMKIQGTFRNLQLSTLIPAKCRLLELSILLKLNRQDSHTVHQPLQRQASLCPGSHTELSLIELRAQSSEHLMIKTYLCLVMQSVPAFYLQHLLLLHARHTATLVLLLSLHQFRTPLPPLLYRPRVGLVSVPQFPTKFPALILLLQTTLNKQE